MNCGMPELLLKLLPTDDAIADADHRAADYLRCLYAIGACRKTGASFLDSARAVVELIVEHCGDVPLAAVYRAETPDMRAAVAACAGTSPGGGPPPHWLEPSPDLASPQPLSAVEDTALPARRHVVPLMIGGTQVVGWLWLETLGADTAARTLLIASVAQSLADAFDRAHQAKAAQARAEELARREQNVSAFFGKVCNEIRTPLTLILGPLEAAVERHGGDTSLKVALRHGHRLKWLVEALLDLAHIDAGRVEPVLLPIDIAAMTRDIASLFQGAAMAAGITLTIDCPRLPQPVVVDRQQWEQVVVNLLGNALCFSSGGEVRVSLRAQTGLATLEVADTGRGIDPGELPRLFDRFEHAHGRDGGGLGLALVRELIHLHGGDIEATSTPGQGSRFRVCIPMLGQPGRAVPHRYVADLPTRTARVRRLDVLDWTLPEGSPQTDGEPEGLVGPTTRERIVVAIEHRELRHYVTGLLRSHYRVQSLAVGPDALAAVRQRTPDLVLVDRENAGLPGLEFMRRLRASSQGAVVPALLLSSDARDLAHADAVEAGADDVIVKPFAASGLLARVGAHMRLSRDRRALHRRLTDHNRELEAQVASRTAALAASEAQFKAISNLVPDILWRTDAHGQVEWRSEQWRRFTGDESEQDDMSFVHPQDREDTQAWMRDTVSGSRLSPHEFRLRRHDGVYRWFIARMSPMPRRDGRVEQWFGSATDIERHQTARQALEAEVDQRTTALAQAAILQQELLHRLSRSQEDERRRIARELHDSLGQYLTALKLALSALAPAVDDPQLRERIDHLDAITTEVDRELDDIIAALRPVVLDELGLAGALPGIVADWSRQSGIAAEALLLQLGDERFDEESESALYRVAQESLTNVVKHARARNVSVTLTRRHDELQLSVEDDGIGFDVSRHPSGWGLRGMAERVRSIGGLLQVESAPDAGTTVLVRLPCRPRTASDAGVPA